MDLNLNMFALSAESSLINDLCTFLSYNTSRPELQM